MRINRQIRARQVRLIDAEGAQVGIVSLDEALRIAKNSELDLVEIAPNAVPPVCKVIDYGKFRYDETKKEKENKKAQHQVKVKEVKVKPNISDHDLDVKLKNAQAFLEKGNKVKISCMFRGREMAHTAIGQEVINRLLKGLAEVGAVEGGAKLFGRSLIVVVAPVKRK